MKNKESNENNDSIQQWTKLKQKIKKQQRLNKAPISKIMQELNKKEEFRHWLVEKYGKAISTANNYLCGFEAAQKHFRLESESKICFYDIDDIDELQRIFDKYINGEYSVIGKKYSGAVRASLNAYLSFFYQKHKDSAKLVFQGKMKETNN